MTLKKLMSDTLERDRDRCQYYNWRQSTFDNRERKAQLGSVRIAGSPQVAVVILSSTDEKQKQKWTYLPTLTATADHRVFHPAPVDVDRAYELLLITPLSWKRGRLGIILFLAPLLFARLCLTTQEDITRLPILLNETVTLLNKMKEKVGRGKSHLTVILK